MRIVFILLILLLSVSTKQSYAEDKKLGDYGYKHMQLHKEGFVPKLEQFLGHSCCDGGKGGECRSTKIRHSGPISQAFIDGEWCPISVGTKIIYTLPLPKDVQAVVCAPKYEDGCPPVYCAVNSVGG